MRFSERVDRISGDGAAAWKIHSAAVADRRAGRDVVVLSIGDPDFSTPAAITDVAVAALRRGDTHYTDIPGRPALRAAVARDHTARGGAAVGGDNVIVLAGAQNALFAASLCLFGPGDEVLVLDPTYVTYEATIRVSGADMTCVSPIPQSGFRVDLAALERAVGPRTRAIMFANPNNPSGVVFSRDELQGISGIAQRHDLWVIADEVYGSLTFDAPHISIAALAGMAERTVTVGSLSKAQAMTGWRCGWMIGPEALIRHADNLSLCMLYGLPGFVQEGAIEALTNARAEMDAMREVYRRRRDMLHAALSELSELSVLKPEAGMFLMADVRGTGLSASDFSWGLYREQGVSVLDATAFGASAAGFVRISYTLGEKELMEGATRVRHYVESLRGNTRRRAAG